MGLLDSVLGAVMNNGQQPQPGAQGGAGSVITKDVARDALAVTRADQKEIPGWAEKFRARKRAEKAKPGQGGDK